MAKTLSEISEAMRDIDFCVLSSRAPDGSIGGRPMSNNRNVDYSGTSWFFTYANRKMIADIARDASIGLSYVGNPGLKGLVGAPGIFIHIEGEARLIEDRQSFAEHWDKELDRWFPQGIETPGIVLVEVRAKRLHYWHDQDSAEVPLRA